MRHAAAVGAVVAGLAGYGAAKDATPSNERAVPIAGAPPLTHP